jgi:hypothetical protein
MNKYAIFGVMAGIALLTTTIVSILPVQRALAVCTSNPFTVNVKIACANDPRIGGGAFATAPPAAAAASNSFNGGVGHVCATNGHVLVCVP